MNWNGCGKMKGMSCNSMKFQNRVERIRGRLLTWLLRWVGSVNWSSKHKEAILKERNEVGFGQVQFEVFFRGYCG